MHIERIRAAILTGAADIKASTLHSHFRSNPPLSNLQKQFCVLGASCGQLAVVWGCIVLSDTSRHRSRTQAGVAKRDTSSGMFSGVFIIVKCLLYSCTTLLVSSSPTLTHPSENLTVHHTTGVSSASEPTAIATSTLSIISQGQRRDGQTKVMMSKQGDTNLMLFPPYNPNLP